MATRAPLNTSFAEPSRRAILEHLTTGPKSVNELVELTGLSQPNVSNHLSRMRATGAVNVTQSGRQRVYELAGAIPPAALLASRSSEARPLSAEELKDAGAKLFAALVEGDQRQAWKVVHDCVSREPSLVPLYSDVMTPALQRIGEWYERGRISEADEHLASGLAERLMAYAANSVPAAPWNGLKAIIGAVAGNYHVIGARMVADTLQQQGWEVRYLGANVPTPSFVKMVSLDLPDLVMASASVQGHALETESLGKQLGALRAQGATFRFAIGGAAVRANPSLLKASGADFTAGSLGELLKTVEKIPSRSGTV